jgi:ATP:ADP antiporter, AAA family
LVKTFAQLENKSWTYKLLNIEKGEGTLVALPTIYSFFAGASLSYFVTSSTSLFLNSFERDMLSVAFIAAGVIVWLIGLVFSQIQKKIDFSKSLVIGLGFLLVSLLALVGLYIGVKSAIIIFLIYAWIRVFAYMHAVTFWGLAGRLFSIRQGKRLFGLISGGEVIASIISFFSVPFLLKVINTEDLLIISGFTLLIAFLLFLVITRKYSGTLASNVKPKAKSESNSKVKKTSFLQNRYYQLFFVIAFVPIFAQFFVDYIFQAQAKIEYPTKEDLTAFVGIFFGFSSIVEFILKTFISGRLMSRYGIKLGLVAFPAVMILSLIFACLFGFIYGALSMFFSFIALGRLFTRAVRIFQRSCHSVALSAHPSRRTGIVPKQSGKWSKSLCQHCCRHTFTDFCEDSRI